MRLCCSLIAISLSFVSKGPINNLHTRPSLVQITACRLIDTKPFSEPVMVLFTRTYTHGHIELRRNDVSAGSYGLIFTLTKRNEGQALNSCDGIRKISKSPQSRNIVKARLLVGYIFDISESVPCIQYILILMPLSHSCALGHTTLIPYDLHISFIKSMAFSPVSCMLMGLMDFHQMESIIAAGEAYIIQLAISCNIVKRLDG